MMTLTPLTASSRSASGSWLLNRVGNGQDACEAAIDGHVDDGCAFATLAFGFRFQRGGVDAPRVQERRVSEKHLVAFDGSEGPLACHSACNIDPLSRGIGVQN
jgi:hypothetical protein